MITYTCDVCGKNYKTDSLEIPNKWMQLYYIMRKALVCDGHCAIKWLTKVVPEEDVITFKQYGYFPGEETACIEITGGNE